MQMANANAARLKKITNLAKKLRKRRPGLSWQSAVKQAGASVKKGSGGSKRKRVTRKKSVSRKRSVSRKKSAPRSKKTIASLKGEIRHKLKDQLGKKLVSRELATRKTQKRKISKNITDIKRQLRQLL